VIIGKGFQKAVGSYIVGKVVLSDWERVAHETCSFIKPGKPMQNGFIE
jgi:hypothetical protein